MKRLLLTMLLGTFFCIADALALVPYRVIEIRGTVKHNGTIMRRGYTLDDNDFISSTNKSIIKFTDEKRSYTAKLTGKRQIKKLIESIPDVFDVAVNNIRRQIASNINTRKEYSLITMGFEEVPMELQENEAVALCKEDSPGNLTVTFMHHGMDKPLRYKMDAETYNYLLRMNIITSKGCDYAYTSKEVYENLWKPIEQYMKEGDAFMYLVPIFLSDIDMTQLPVSDETVMGEKYDMTDMGTE